MPSAAVPPQEVDEAKEATSEVLQRVDDVKRHTNALEGKLESFNTQVGEPLPSLHLDTRLRYADVVFASTPLYRVGRDRGEGGGKAG